MVKRHKFKPKRLEEKRKEKRISFYFEWNLFNLERENTQKLNSKD